MLALTKDRIDVEVYVMISVPVSVCGRRGAHARRNRHARRVPAAAIEKDVSKQQYLPWLVNPDEKAKKNVIEATTESDDPDEEGATGREARRMRRLNGILPITAVHCGVI